MYYIKKYKVIGLIIGIFIVVSLILYKFIPELIQSNILIALVTFIVGCFAIGLYISQKVDEKRDAANVILAEIRYAEKLIDQLKNSGISNDIQYQILPSNSWGKYGYIFINELDQDEIGEINNFYNQCFIMDRALDQVNISYELKHKSQAIHTQISVIAKESLGNMDLFEQNKNNFVRLIDNDTYTFRPIAPINAIAKTLNNIRFVTTSTAGAKLKSIAQQR